MWREIFCGLWQKRTNGSQGRLFGRVVENDLLTMRCVLSVLHRGVRLV